jgi:hypothetical protein
MKSFWSTQLHEDLLTQIFVGTDSDVLTLLARHPKEYLASMMPQGVSPASGATSLAALCFLHGKHESVRLMLADQQLGLSIELITSWRDNEGQQPSRQSLLKSAAKVGCTRSLRLALELAPLLGASFDAEQAIQEIRACAAPSKCDVLVALVHEHAMAQVLRCGASTDRPEASSRRTAML